MPVMDCRIWPARSLAHYRLPVVAQIFNLLYRRIVFGRGSDHPNASALPKVRRYNFALLRSAKHIPAQWAAYSDVRCQSAESAFHWLSDLSMV